MRWCGSRQSAFRFDHPTAESVDPAVREYLSNREATAPPCLARHSFLLTATQESFNRGLLGQPLIAALAGEMGDATEAVSILAGVLANPVSNQSTMISTTSVYQMAMDLLAEIGVDLDAETYATTHTAGNALGVAVTAKELLSAG